MKKFKYFIAGFFGFLLVTGFNVSIAVVFYSRIEYKEDYQIALLLLVVIIINAFFCSLLDAIRRKIMIQKPLNEILDVTKSMTKGNFKLRLIPKHMYKNYDEFDLIKENLNQMAEELSKNEVLKNDFIANISHEIKTPLAIIQNYSKALENINLSEEERERYLKNMRETCKRLDILIKNILRLNKLENNKISSEFTTFNLSEVLASQILFFENPIEEKEIILNCDIQEDLFIKSEKDYLEIVFNNLISNAIKFTPNKGIINIGLKKEKEDYIVEIQDTGCGIDKETGKHIFDKFYQGDTSHSKEGNGLGLALVKKVIDIIGGTIKVESEVGKGTKFTIIIRSNENE